MNLYYRAYTYKLNISDYANVNNEKVDIKGIAGSIQMILNRIKDHLQDNGHIYFLFDNAKTLHRRQDAVDPDYKKNRKKMPKSFYRGLDYLEVILRNFINNGRVIRITSAEADDLVKPVLLQVKDTEYTLLISTDLDWARSLSEKTHWLDKRDIIDLDVFESKYGYPACEHSIIFHKSFYGDKTDNIVGALKQFPKVYFKSVIENYTDMKDFIFDAIKKRISYLDEGWIERIEQDKGKLYSNWDLVSFQPISNIDLERYIRKTEFNHLKLYWLYDSIQILGKVDVKRVQKTKTDIVNAFLNNEKLPRRK